LKDDENVWESFKIELKYRFQVLTDMENMENETIKEKWRKIQTAFTEASENVLDFKEKNKKDWMTQQTWEKIRGRKNVKEELNACKTQARKAELQNKYAEKNREVKKSARRDQRNWIDNLSYEAEEAANKGNLKELFAITRVLSKKQIQRNRPIRNKSGTLLTNTEDQLKRWQEHFSKILNCPLNEQVDEDEGEEYEANPRINTRVPTMVEIKKALKEL
jgi:hypothetical protein